MNNLLTHLNVVDYFQKRRICILCGKNLQDNQPKCNTCLTAQSKHVAYILDTDISSLLTTIVSRLANEIQEYKHFFLNASDEKPYDIPFAKQYKKLLIQYHDKNFFVSNFTHRWHKSCQIYKAKIVVVQCFNCRTSTEHSCSTKKYYFIINVHWL